MYELKIEYCCQEFTVAEMLEIFQVLETSPEYCSGTRINNYVIIDFLAEIFYIINSLKVLLLPRLYFQIVRKISKN